MIARQGYKLVRSRRRDPRAIDYGAYAISDGSGTVVFGAAVKRTLDDCEQWALAEPSQRARDADPS